MSSDNEETVINAISTLYYLVCPETKSGKLTITSICFRGNAVVKMTLFSNLQSTVK